MEQIVPQIFMLLLREERDHAVKVFDLKRTGISEIVDDRVVADGHTMEDLSAITAEKMADYVQTTGSFATLWELTVAKIRSELHPSPLIPVEVTEDQKIDNTPPIEELKEELKKKKGKSNE